ncbi:hypothetical protein [Vibrio barjaei]|uniref:hypothetical protein n=1 Tax=Vibrio barjaei TaxID=1676683 RepID=UPI002284144F|nr:hypothetical protein [Vibrio barjaei]MCY9874041.1 hypothetical protein [Vibrio barjaei]
MATGPVIPNETFKSMVKQIEDKLWEESVELSNVDKEHLTEQLQKALSEININVEQ